MSGSGSLGVAVTGSQSHSTLAKKYQPGPTPTLKSEKLNIGLGYFFIIFGVGTLLLLWGEKDALPMGLTALVLGIGTVLFCQSRVSDNQNKFDLEMPAWQTRQRMLERGWLCHRCGHSWIP